MRILTLFLFCLFASIQTQAQDNIPGFNFCWIEDDCGINAPNWCTYKLFWDTCDPNLEYDLVVEVTYNNGFSNKYNHDENSGSYLEGAIGPSLYPTQICFLFNGQLFCFDPLDEDYNCSSGWETENCCESGFALEFCPIYNCDPCEDGWSFVCAMGTLPDGTTAQLHTIDQDYVINWINPSSPYNTQCANGFAPLSGSTTLKAEIIDLAGCSHIVTLDISCPNLRMDNGSNIGDTKTPAEQISISPNPANKYLTISNPKELNLTVQIYNLNGQLLKEDNIYQIPSTTINTNDLPEGTYIIQTIDLDTAQSIGSEKLIIEK